MPDPVHVEVSSIAITTAPVLSKASKRRYRRQVLQAARYGKESFKEAVRAMVLPHLDTLNAPFNSEGPLGVLDELAAKKIPAKRVVCNDTAKILASNYKSFFPEIYQEDGKCEVTKYTKHKDALTFGNTSNKPLFGSTEAPRVVSDHCTSSLQDLLNMYQPLPLGYIPHEHGDVKPVMFFDSADGLMKRYEMPLFQGAPTTLK